MNVLIIGSGGREHALTWKISQSSLLERLFVAPGNAGTAKMATNVAIDPADFHALADFCLQKEIKMLVVGPEQPLAEGITDYFQDREDLESLMVFGPDRHGAMLESSKDFAKQFMQRYDIPTAKARTFTLDTLEKGKEYVRKQQPPVVLKADGLAAGKGVRILNNHEEAEQALEEMLRGQFGQASAKVLVEQFLQGTELSVFALTDGETCILLPEAKDYKRIGEGDTGLNTGGMGAVSPVPFADDNFMEKVYNQVVLPTITGLKEEGIDYTGIIFFGLVNVAGNPMVIEYNVRLGDPESEVILPRFKPDLLECMLLACRKDLSKIKAGFDKRVATTVMLVSGGYPGDYEKGKTVTGLADLPKNVLPFHAGTQLAENGSVKTSGGRVIALTALGNTMQQALAASYKAAEKVKFPGKYFRKDIGFDL